MKKKKLYIKNDKGRYEEYKPVLETDDCDLLFRNVGKKYIPCERYRCHDTLSEGVWVVLSNLSYAGREIVSGDYLKELFQIHKVGDIEEPTIAQLGGLEKCYDYVSCEWDKYYKEYMLGHEWKPSNSDYVHFIIGKVFEYCKMKETERKEEDNDRTGIKQNEVQGDF